MAKRFYKAVSTEAGEGGYHVLLDGRQLKTPGKISLLLPSQYTADLIAAEWEAQVEEIDPTSMPITRLLNVAVEQTPKNRQALITEARNYAGNDLLCYHAPDPADLTKRQVRLWGAWLDWAKDKGIDLQTTQGVVAIMQPASSLDKVAAYAAEMDDVMLTLFVHLTAVFGSAILALAVIEGELAADEAYELSRLDEAFQNEMWGADDDAVARNDAIRADTVALSKILGDPLC